MTQHVLNRSEHLVGVDTTISQPLLWETIRHLLLGCCFNKYVQKMFYPLLKNLKICTKVAASL